MPASENGSALADKAASAAEQAAAPLPALRSAPPPVAAPAAKPRRLWLWGLGLLVVLGAGGLFYFQPWVAKATTVVVEIVAPGPVTRVLAVNGRIASEQSVEVRPQVSGTLAEVLVAEGALVARGADLARIDPATQQAVVRQAVAALDAALVTQEEAVATHSRTRALGANAARATLDTAARAEQSAAQQVAQMTALLDQARIELGRFTIRAPMAGTVLVKAVDPGQIVDPTTGLMTIADLSRLVVETDVDESYATQILVGQSAALQLSGEAAVRDGHVSFVSQKVDPATGGLVVKLRPDATLVAPVGLTVTANILVDDRAAALTVPRAAIVKEAEGDAVFVVVGGVAERRAVTVIDWPAARQIVTEGLAPGDQVIADATGLVAGQAVKVAP